MIEAGLLRQRVAFDEPMSTQDDTGGEIVTWTLAFTLNASVEPLTGREQMMGGGILAEGNVRIRIYWSSMAARINAKWRARHNGTIYDIKSIADIASDRRQIEIMAKSGPTNG